MMPLTVAAVNFDRVISNPFFSKNFKRKEDTDLATKTPITIPNKHIVGEIIHNSEERKIVEEMVGISYDSDPEKAIQIIKDVLETFQEISMEPPPQIGIQEFGDSSINIGLRYWIPTNKYFKTLYQVNLSVYKHLKSKNIEIPFPQRDVHIVSQAQEGPPSIP